MMRDLSVYITVYEVDNNKYNERVVYKCLVKKS